VKLLGTLSLAKLGWDGSCLNDLDAWKPHPVARCHLSVHLFNSTIKSCVAVFLVHVVIASSALVSQPYSIILDLGRILLKNLQSENNYLKMLATLRCNKIAEKPVHLSFHQAIHLQIPQMVLKRMRLNQR
jgi:hypothetical protein